MLPLVDRCCIKLLIVPSCCGRARRLYEVTSRDATEAERVQPKESLKDYRDAIECEAQELQLARDAQFLAERGVETDHTKLFRFMKQQERQKWKTPRSLSVRLPTNTRRLLRKSRCPRRSGNMLEFHYGAHNRTVTYTELAKAAGWDDYRTAEPALRAAWGVCSANS